MAVRAGGLAGRVRGYATPGERHEAGAPARRCGPGSSRVDQRIEDGRLSVMRGGRNLLRKRRTSRPQG